jgi:dienelactone hydrolase
VNRGRLIAVAVTAVALTLPPVAHAFDAGLEAKNFAKTSERMQYVTLTPEFQARLVQANTENAATAAQIASSDPERVFAGNVCANGGNECAGDVRFYDWSKNGFGIVKPVLFTARNGSTISGRVWSTTGGPARKPAVVITTGSVQAPEQLYWGQAATLAKHGYVVLTYDVQGQGRSDTFGEGADLLDGVPSQAGEPFYDDTEDALDFMLSTKSHPYDPRPSCSSGTDHSAKQDRRVASGLDAAYNPLASGVDRSRVAIAGHSLGAAAVSYVGQLDDRVDAITAWDNLRAPDASQDPGAGPGGPPDCASGSSPRPDQIPITKPALGITNDYGIDPMPNTADPDPQTGNDGFLAYKQAGVDSMELHIRGGTHEESAFIPGDTEGYLGLASLRGGDFIAWYTTAWFDRYVKCKTPACKAEADRRLLSDRWRDDTRSGDIDLNQDANVFSFYGRSRFDIGVADGGRRRCDDMRAGCSSMRADGQAAGYSFVSDAYSAPHGVVHGSGGEACVLPQRGSNARDTAATLPPSGGGDAIRGRGGNDRLRGGAGRDCLYGNRGADRLAGGRAADRLKGGRGNDMLLGSRGRDRMIGGVGNDRIVARGGGRDLVRCGAGPHDIALVDRRDKVARGCERVRRARKG